MERTRITTDFAEQEASRKIFRLSSAMLFLMSG